MTISATIVGLMGCTVEPLTPERAHLVCSEQAREAAGPTGRVTIGTNSQTGAYIGGEIGLSGDYLSGRAPQEVYEDCYYKRTGGLEPSRQPEL